MYRCLMRTGSSWFRGLFCGAASIALLAAALIVVGAFASTGASAAAGGDHARMKAPGLERIGSCKRLRGYLLSHPRALDAYGDAPVGEPVPGPSGPVAGGGAGGAPTPPPGSSTNVQEPGVDEPDIVKADATTIFAVSGTTLRAIDVGPAAPELAGQLELPNDPGDGSQIGSFEILLAGERLLAIGTAYAYGPPIPGPPSSGSPGIGPPGEPHTLLVEIDVSDPARMAVVRTASVDGTYVSARLNGATARVVINDFPAPQGDGTGPPHGLLPKLTVANATTGESRRRKLLRCAAVRRPTTFAGPEMLSVLTIDLARGVDPVDVDTVLTNGQIVYASTENLYVASERWADSESPPERISDVSTEIHRFRIGDRQATAYVGSGRVDGFMLNQWSLSEHEGRLRVASTTAPPWEVNRPARETESFVTVLAPDSEQAGLRRVGRVGGIGRGERIYAVRFIGELGYVVTFRQVDPLHVIDLADPARPRVAGELVVPGYSAYLHPVGGQLLLGIGREATDEGQVLGVQASLFDVSDPAQPVRVDQESLGGRSSYTEVEYNHHAFSFFAQYALAMVPIESYPFDGGEAFAGAVGLQIAPGSADPLAPVAEVEHGTTQTPIRRSLVLGDAVYTVSAAGVAAHDPATLAQTGFVGF